MKILRTVSLGSNFTGSYKKKGVQHFSLSDICIPEFIALSVKCCKVLLKI